MPSATRRPRTGWCITPGFEYTAATQTPLGWTTAGPDAAADFTQSYGRTSLYQLAHQSTAPYQVRTYQLLSGLPNGTYTLRAWAQRSGNQPVCELYASGFGGPAERRTAVPAAPDWVRVEVPGIVVSNGQCEIGLRSEGAADAFCALDDVEFLPTAVTAVASAAGELGVEVFPNPLGGQGTLRYTLARPETVQVSLFSLTGQLVRELVPTQRLSAGPQQHPLLLDAAVPPGLYLLRIRHGSQQQVQKIMKY